MRSTIRFFEMKRAATPIVMLTVYDAPTARAEAEAGIDILLVGDSVGTNMLGYASEQEVTLADIAHHTRAVRRGAPDAFIVSDLPYKTYETTDMALSSAKTLRQAGADMVKFEGARPDIAAAIVAAGIDVCAHLGLEPQHHAEKRLKGRSAADAAALLRDAIAMDGAKIAMMVLELVPEEVAAAITCAIEAPTIGIGAGRHTDGQVLVVCDVLGFTAANFKHNKRYDEFGTRAKGAAERYAADVRARAFPGEANAFRMPSAELAAFSRRATPDKAVAD